ncbi:hypothetical protein [Stenotrophomonas terrae]|nr:hypothetical protein [Stenotrophomonas terrae]
MTPRRYRTRMGLVLVVAILGGITGAIVGGLLAYDGKYSWLALPLWTLGGVFAVELIAAPIMWQRVVVDEKAGHLRYHNISTAHRWRQVPLFDVLEVRYDNFADKSKGMVSGLYLHMRNGSRPASHRLMDNEMGSYQGPSPMFRDIAATVLRAQPRSLVDPSLLAAQ